MSLSNKPLPSDIANKITRNYSANTLLQEYINTIVEI